MQWKTVWRVAGLSMAACLLATTSFGAVKMKKDTNGGEMILFTSGKLNLGFEMVGKKLAFTELSDEKGTNWLNGRVEPSVLWSMGFNGPNEERIDITSAEVDVVTAKFGEDDIRFTWNAPLGDKAAAVTMTIRAKLDSPLSFWSLQAKLPAGWKVNRADYPIVPNVRFRKGLKFAAPCGWGLEYDVKSGVHYQGTYPSCAAAMQFMAFYTGGSGVYIGAHDAQGNHKVLTLNTDASGAKAFFTNWPAISAAADGGTYKLPYEAVVGVFSGDYYQAAQIYREFTFKTPWGKAGPVSKRPIPQWVKDNDLWLRPHYGPEQNVPVVKQALKYFDVPTSLHWYQWHKIPYDTLYPEYFPPLDGFADAVKELQDLGTHVMPYINGRLCDPNSKTWTEEQGSKSAARQENGEPYTEIYGSKVPLNAMCPYTAQWQNKISGLVERMTGELGVQGVYIDQIGAAYAVRCFDASHGHPIGGGHFWVDGYRKMLNDVRAKLPKGRMITTEENAECWIDQFDALLLVNTSTSASNIIPLFPAVYSGRAITFGFLYFPKDDLEKSLPFRYKMAQCFLWGSQLGWIEPEKMMDPANAKESEYLRNLARCRRFGHEFLAYGRFEGLLDVRGDNPHVKGEATGSFSGTYQIDMPSVTGSVWLAEDGSLGVALTNMSDDAHEIEVRLPLDKAGIIASKGFTVQTFGPEGSVSKVEAKSSLQKVSVPARSAIILSISAADELR